MALTMRPKSQFSGAHITLKRLWDEYVARTGMSQEEFGEAYGIGTQGMVSQYLLGTVPLNYEVAAKFARGLNCTIEDISPDMARVLLKDIIPVLGRSLRRRKNLACLAWLIPFVLSLFASQPVDARTLHNSFSSTISRTEYALHAIARIIARLARRFGLVDGDYAFG